MPRARPPSLVASIGLRLAWADLSPFSSTTNQNEIKGKISLATNSPDSSANGSASRRTELKAELDGLRGQQGDAKAKRGKLLDELKRVREDIQKKVSARSLGWSTRGRGGRGTGPSD